MTEDVTQAADWSQLVAAAIDGVRPHVRAGGPTTT
jgi:hypothetical protein